MVDKKPNRVDSHGIVHAYEGIITGVTLNNKPLMRCEVFDQGEGVYAVQLTWRAVNGVTYFLVDDSTPTDLVVTCLGCLGR